MNAAAGERTPMAAVSCRAVGGIVVAILAAGFVLLAGFAPAGAATGDVAVARIQGTWRLTVVVQAYTNSQAPGGTPVAGGSPPVGHSGTETVQLVSTCPSVGHCSLVMRSATGKYRVVGRSGFTVGVATDELAQSGATWALPLPGGFGFGPCTVSPPPSVYRASFTVTAAKHDATGWQATAITGSEVNLLFSCSTHQVSFQHLVISHGVFVPPPPPTTTTVAPAPTTTTTTPVSAPVASSSSASGGTRRSGLAEFLPSPRVVFADPTLALVNALIALGTVLFITFPAHLFNHTLEENYDEIRAFWRRRLAVLKRPQQPPAVAPATATATAPAGAEPAVPSRRRGTVTFVIVSLLGAVLGALLNPHFGLNRTALATFIATLLAILAGLSVSTAVNVGYRRVRHRNFEARLHALPAGLVIAIGCVLMSRLAHFQPGYLYGIVCGVAFTPLARDEEGHIVALDVGAVLAIAVLAWLIRIPVDHAAVRANASFWVITLDDLLAALVVSSLVGSVLSLFPLRFLPGAKLAAWRRGAWAAVFGLAVFALTEVILHPAGHVAHPGHAPVVTAILLFVGFGGGSVAFAAYFSRRKRPVPA